LGKQWDFIQTQKTFHIRGAHAAAAANKKSERERESEPAVNSKSLLSLFSWGKLIVLLSHATHLSRRDKTEKINKIYFSQKKKDSRFFFFI
jgi:hypothetical protein